MSIHECKIDSALTKMIKKSFDSVPPIPFDLLKNSSYDLRGDIKPQPNVNVGPWNISSINPESLETTDVLFNDSQNMPLYNNFRRFCVPLNGEHLLVHLINHVMKIL